ncbi:hypothetical protein ACHAW5_002503 [Stephanodiscus triporus]|uniref:Propionate--CoA ligase n=1 Tax=Stephanodiscus triporus TaxID=2934178 RepID=A0ABD3R159_9STRA
MVVLPRRLQRPAFRLMEASARSATTFPPKFHLHPRPDNGSWWCRRRIIVVPECASLSTTTTTTTTPERASGRFGRYKDEYDESLRDGRRYWLDAASELDWHTPPTYENALVAPHPESHRMPPRWFADGVVNASYNCLDVHARAHPDRMALIYDSPVTNVRRRYTYAELLDEVSRFAHALSGLGVNTGDRVVIYMPMIPEAVIAMLGCARIGAVHSVVFGGFAARELASRIDDAEPRVIVSASGGVLPGGKTVPYKSLLGEALDMARWKGVERCVIVQREGILECALTRGMDVSYVELMESSNEKMDAVPLPSAHPLYTLYTSGTTGLPKGIVRDTGGYATALKWSMSKFYDCEPGDVFFAASDIGWVVSHSYTVYGPLLHGCTTILYEGKPVGTPDAGAFWRIVEEHGVNVLFSAPTAFRAMRQADPDGLMTKKYDLSTLRAVFVAGERSDPSTLHWIEHILRDNNIPAIDHWWQTELGFPGAGKIGQNNNKCAAAVPGYDFRVFDDDGNECPRNTLGALGIKLPLPPGTLPTLYNDDERFISEYLTKFPGYYETKDAGIIDDDGYISIMARTDDVICTAGYRLSTGAMEEILLEHSCVTDCAVFGVNDKLRGEVPIGLVVVTDEKEGLISELVAHVRATLGSHSNLKKLAIVKALPKTRSGKVLRGTMRKIANGEDYIVTPTIEDATVLTDLTPVILKLVE